MNLITLGRTTLNLDRVARIMDLSTIDASGQVVQGLIRVEFDGQHHVEIAHDAGVFRTWLAGHALKLGEPGPG